MKNNTRMSFIFYSFIGFGIGFFAGWKIQEKQSKPKIKAAFEAADKEVESVKKSLSNLPKVEKTNSTATEQKNETETERLRRITNELKEEAKRDQEKSNGVFGSFFTERLANPVEFMDAYRSHSEFNVNPDDLAEPYLISSDEFGTIDDYDAVCLTYYQDGYLIRDTGEEVEDIEGVIGREALARFGDEPGDDVVYVRNERNREDYEILFSGEEYND